MEEGYGQEVEAVLQPAETDTKSGQILVTCCHRLTSSGFQDYVV